MNQYEEARQIVAAMKKKPKDEGRAIEGILRMAACADHYEKTGVWREQKGELAYVFCLES